ncbi:MAG: metal-dependent hydrolase [Candidatus Nezhaarchaeota archaeon]|nr:metal-dependent hydrolase [Candidatus Nezhaarchaeota archaeon]
MLKKGHLGLSLAVVFSFYVAFNVRGSEALLVAAFIAGLSTLPDLDLNLMLRHRGATHSLLTGLLVGLVTGAILMHYLDFFTGFLIGFGGVLLHLVGDALTYSPLRPLWPFSRRKFSLRLFRSNSEAVNNTALTLGVLVAILYMLYAYR